MSDTNRHEALNGPGRYFASAGLAVALFAGAAELASGPGSRLGIWQFRTGFLLLRLAAIAGLFGAALSLLGGIFSGPRRHSLRMAVAGLVVGLVVAGIPWSWSRTAQTIPRIHDITTDTADPPSFSAILPLRRDAPNPASYGGPAVAELQLRAYSDIRPLVLTAPAGQVFKRALAAGRDMGWKIVAADPEKGRIEATATTFWFGFKDDVVVRITPEKEGTRLDVRSVSRVGASDLGTNAKRIRTFLEKMKKAFPGRVAAVSYAPGQPASG